MQKKNYKSGFIPILGRPNVGKSTLMNAFVGEKVAIVSPKAQTTRSRIMGVVTSEDWQIVFLDTPGLHEPRTKLGEYMVKATRDALDEMDLLLIMVDASDIREYDRKLVEKYSHAKVKKILAVNKCDLVSKETLAGVIASFAQYPLDEIVPVSALQGDGMETLRTLMVEALPEGPQYFPDDMITDQPERIMIAEIIREKALRHLNDEVPHGIGVEILKIEGQGTGKTVTVHANIICEKDTHKGIIIGRRGSMIGQIGQEARADIEKLLDAHVNLQLWVKVRTDWRNRAEDLKTLGYDGSNG
ncbi:MAG: GTPase Era [Clostridia bacterium]|nr:GTPase Era [Clostridia bacterium]